MSNIEEVNKAFRQAVTYKDIVAVKLFLDSGLITKSNLIKCMDIAEYTEEKGLERILAGYLMESY